MVRNGSARSNAPSRIPSVGRYITHVQSHATQQSASRETPPRKEPQREQETSSLPWLALVAEKVKQMRFGVLQIVIHDSRVVQIERTERTRFDVPQAELSTLPPKGDRRQKPHLNFYPFVKLKTIFLTFAAIAGAGDVRIRRRGDALERVIRPNARALSGIQRLIRQILEGKNRPGS